MLSKSAIKAVESYVEMPAHIRDLAAAANADLYYGDTSNTSSEDYPGFEPACRILRDWLDDYSTLYVEQDSEFVSNREPEHISECETCEGSGYVWREARSEHETSCMCDCDNDECDAFAEQLPPYYTLERRDIASILFGNELAQYL